MPDINLDDFRAYIEQRFISTNEKLDNVSASIASLTKQLQDLEKDKIATQAINNYKQNTEKKHTAQRRNDLLLLTGVLSVVVVVVNVLLRFL